MPATAAEQGGRAPGTPAGSTVASAGRRRPIVWGVLPRELAAAFLVLVVAVLLSPARPGQGPAAPTWDYQHEQVVIAGGGPLNAYSRAAISATAWLGRASIERQRDVDRLNLLRFIAGEPLAAGLAAWRQHHQAALQGGTAAAVLALVGFGVLARPARRTWLVALLLLLGLTVLVTKPETSMRVASAPSTAIPAGVAGLAGTPSPAGRAGAPPPPDRRVLAGRYWLAFVAGPLSRLQTGSPVLATAAPAAKAGVLTSISRRVPGVRAWAAGRHALQRAVIATLALGYLLPFAALLGVLAMVATCAQALLLLLGLAALVAAPLALEPRWRPAVTRWWLRPLIASLLLLTVTTLTSLLVMWSATLLHVGDDLLGTLLAGSAWPVLSGALAIWWLQRRRALRAAAEGRPSGRALRDLVAAARPRLRGAVAAVRLPGRGVPAGDASAPRPSSRGTAPTGRSRGGRTAPGTASAATSPGNGTPTTRGSRPGGRRTVPDLGERRTGADRGATGRSGGRGAAGDRGAAGRPGRRAGGDAAAARRSRGQGEGRAAPGGPLPGRVEVGDRASNGRPARAGGDAPAGRSRDAGEAGDVAAPGRPGRRAGGVAAGGRASGRRATGDTEPGGRTGRRVVGAGGEWP
jgi:hypothetical protein